MRTTGLALMVAAALGLGAASPSHAAMAVIDVSAIRQLVQQVTTLRDQLANLRDQLRQAQQAYAAITGPRGMERLAAGIARNYLPPDWAELSQVLADTTARYRTLARQVADLERGNALLRAEKLAALGPELEATVQQTRRAVALSQVVAREALETSSRRFANVQSLIDAIGSARDPKAIMDLSARIQAEQAMLTNEQTKLAMLQQALEAEQAVRQQQAREQAVSDVGSLRSLPPMGL